MSTDPCPTCATERARAEAAEARLATLLAPVKEVDLNEILRLDREATPGPWKLWGFDVLADLDGSGDIDTAVPVAYTVGPRTFNADLIAAYRTTVPVIAREIARLRDLCRRLLPARYIAADGQVMDPALCTPHAPDCAECGRGRAHDEECLGVQPTPAEEIAALKARLTAVERERDAARAEAEELHLTLAAEQGRAEGAPSAGWTPRFEYGQFPAYQWRKTFPNGERVTVDYFPVERRWEWCFMDRPNRENFPWVRERYAATARAAMCRVDASPSRLAAGKAQP